MLVRRSAYERVGPFRSGLRVAEGLDWLLRAHELGLREATAAEQVQWRRIHVANNSLTQGDAIQEFPRTLKAHSIGPVPDAFERRTGERGLRSPAPQSLS
jgi:hypothetical protein